MNTLAIHHVAGIDPPVFRVSRGDQKGCDPVAVTSPRAFPVEGRPESNLILELRWYLEDFLDYPFSPNTDRADRIVEALQAWGREAFQKLFGSRDAGRMFDEATRDGYDRLNLQIFSDDPQVLAWPWEVLRDPEATYLTVSSRIERRLNHVRDPMPIPADLPRDRINVLLVTARPYEEDVRYRSISRPLVELIQQHGIPAEVHVLRPPTFQSLRERLRGQPHFFHLIHFDGHGNYGSRAPGGGSHSFAGPEGVLVFENDAGGEDRVTAEQLSGLLREHAVPAMVLNACRSAMVGPEARDPFSSVAAALVQAGVHGVVAMAWSLYVSAAQEFLPAFYRELFATGDLSAATRAGRRQMFAQRNRVCARGRYELNDFLVPVLYQQDPGGLSFAVRPAGAAAPAPPQEKPPQRPPQKPPLPEEALDAANPYGFIGRDRELLRLERAIRQETPAVLIQGLGGVGKTTLASGFVKWLHQTQGLEGCLWLSFVDVHSAEYVLNRMGEALFGPSFAAHDAQTRLAALAQRLKQVRLMIVWDNFEVAAGSAELGRPGNLSPEDRTLLLALLEKIRGGRAKVLITSRSEEPWLGIQRLRVSIGGLSGEERWEYCEKILRGLGLSVNRQDPDQVELMKLLDGHPLAMRIVLPRLENMSARHLIDAIRSNMTALGPGADALYGSLQLAADGLAADLQPLLLPLALHEEYADADYLTAMAGRVDPKWTQDHIARFFEALTVAGVVQGIGENVFQLHPALTGFLRFKVLGSAPPEDRDPWTRVFVDVMARLADAVAPRELHEQRSTFHCHGTNFRLALREAESSGMTQAARALTQSLAAYAQRTRNFAEAHGLFESRARLCHLAGHEEGEAAAYHQLGVVALEQRDFAAADTWYRKSLEISERLGKEHGAAITYHQLGRIAQERGGFAAAETWYGKSLEITERLGIEHCAAGTYHQLGRIAEDQRDFTAAETWYRKSLEITERLGIEHCAASTYHQLGRIAQERGGFAAAKTWYHKSLEIEERLGIEHCAASTYHELGRIGQEERDFAAAERWYHKSLEIEERLGNEHGAAMTYGNLGILAGIQGDFEGSTRWLVRAVRSFLQTNDPAEASRNSRIVRVFYARAPKSLQPRIKAIWEEAGLGPFPEPGEPPD